MHNAYKKALSNLTEELDSDDLIKMKLFAAVTYLE